MDAAAELWNTRLAVAVLCGLGDFTGPWGTAASVWLPLAGAASRGEERIGAAPTYHIDHTHTPSVWITDTISHTADGCHLVSSASQTAVITTLQNLFDAQDWASECPDVKNYKWRLNPVWHRMLYSCTHMATVGFKGLSLWNTNPLRTHKTHLCLLHTCCTVLSQLCTTKVCIMQVCIITTGDYWTGVYCVETIGCRLYHCSQLCWLCQHQTLASLSPWFYWSNTSS